MFYIAKTKMKLISSTFSAVIGYIISMAIVIAIWPISLIVAIKSQSNKKSRKTNKR